MTLAIVAGNPLIRAQALLGERLAETAGGWRLDGRPSSTVQVVEAANDVADRRGEARIAYPGVTPARRRAAR